MAEALPLNVRPQVFINFRGELRSNFVSHLHSTLRDQGINAFIDSDEEPGVLLANLLRRIEESTVAIAILSSRYTESRWCLKELVKIKKCVDRGTLRVIPVFYKLETSTVRKLKGNFGRQLWKLWRRKNHRRRDGRILKWDAALQDVRRRQALIFEENSIEEVDLVDKITKHVQNFLTKAEGEL